MKRLFLLHLLVYSFYVQAQTLDSLQKKYAAGEFAFVIEHGPALEKEDPNNLDLKLLLGRSYTDAGMPDKAIPCLLYVDREDEERKWRAAWATAYLGSAYFQKGDYEQSKNYLQECIRLNATENASRFAQKRMALFGFSDSYKDFIKQGSKNIIFHFELGAISKIESINDFVQKHEEAFGSINKFFDSKLPKKIDFFVWSTNEALTAATQSPGGFSDPLTSICHTMYFQTTGHELTHVVSNYTAPIAYKSVLINEGTAVYFDQTNRNRLDHAKQLLERANFPVSVLQLWNMQSSNETILYAIGGALVEYLLKKEGKEKFLAFFRNQSYKNAVKVYGNKFDGIITEFEGKLNVQSTTLPAAQKFSEAQVNAVIDNDPKSKYYRVLILVNEKPATRSQMEQTDPRKIKDVKVITDKKQIAEFAETEMNLNGIIILSTF